MTDEYISYQIAEFLRKNCPSLLFTKSGVPYRKTGSVWHGCKCKITSDSCICVWHRTNICHQGEWNMPFLKANEEKIKEAQAQAQEQMKNVPTSILTI